MNHLSPNQWRARARSLAKKLRVERLHSEELEQRWVEQRQSTRHFANQLLSIRDLVCKGLGIKVPPPPVDDLALVKELIES